MTAQECILPRDIRVQVAVDAISKARWYRTLPFMRIYKCVCVARALNSVSFGAYMVISVCVCVCRLCEWKRIKGAVN